MKTKLIWTGCLLAAAAFLLGGCVEEMPGAQSEVKALSNVHATLSEAETRAYLTDGNAVRWGYRDKIGVFSDQTTQIVPFECYTSDETGGEFRTDTPVSGHTFYAVYPYGEDIRVVEDRKIAYRLNSVQEFEDSSFDPASCPMVATSTNTEFMFRQTCGLIRIKLKGTMRVNKVILTSNDGTPIAGDGFIDFSEEIPLFRLDGQAESLTDHITVQGAKLLNTDQETSFYFVVPEVTLEKGFNISIIDLAQGELTVTMRTDKPVDIRRATITTFKAVDTELEMQLDEEENRRALIALYDAMGGPNWTRQENWCTDAPLSEWEGVRTDSGGRVLSLVLNDNNLTGSIPKEIGDLAWLEFLYLNNNNLTGTIPAEMSRLSNLQYLNVGNNRFSGALPAELTATDWWKRFGWNFVNSLFLFDFDTYNLYIQDFTCPDMDGNMINSLSFVKGNKYTIYYEWTADLFTTNGSPVQNVATAYQRYRNLGLNVLGLCTDADEYQDLAQEYRRKYGMVWPVMVNNDPFDIWNCFGSRRVNVVYLFDENGKLLYYNGIHGDENLLPMLEELLGPGEVYESTDYSADGTYHPLHDASKTGAKPIHVVLMGDGFSDRQIKSGLYGELMYQAMKAFFMQEPFYSHRDYFTVSYVDVVSKHEGVMEGNETALECYLGSGTTIGGSDARCREYAAKVPALKNDLGEALIVVLANTVEYHGTCYMYADEDYRGDYGGGHAVAYTTLAEPELVNIGTAIHEAAGHGFAKLADEYVSSFKEIPEDRKSLNLELNGKFGWYKNIDYTDDVTKVAWSKYIGDERYAGENIGVFLGGDGYAFGIWHPTENSLMNNNTGEFNAPSREAIYYRIHKLAYGDSWTYNHEEFVEWDMNRMRLMTRSVSSQAEAAGPTAPPVVITGHWENGQFVGRRQ